MHGLDALREAAFNYVGIVCALFVAQISTWTAVGAFLLLLLKIIVELPKAWAVLRGKNKDKDNDD